MSELRRAKVVLLTEEQVLGAFSRPTGRMPPGSVLMRTRFVGLPPDVNVERVAYLPERLAWGIVVSHPSFDEVPFGKEIPSVTPDTEWVAIPLAVP